MEVSVQVDPFAVAPITSSAAVAASAAGGAGALEMSAMDAVIAAARSATKTAQHICGGVGASCVIGAGVMAAELRITVAPLADQLFGTSGGKPLSLRLRVPAWQGGH